ncbi:hypothetical protein SeMB42_g05561 [Synchytrium endobioticum]|uniref:Transmembrane protein 223 n=1 Tax=Synchytrium endobioticum TaxID=286115 RepID=A0A507CQV1_9FUNG|nr:hypothetical protein SeMB42_g05561 [Synchytrium endobioticum]
MQAPKSISLKAPSTENIPFDVKADKRRPILTSDILLFEKTNQHKAIVVQLLSVFFLAMAFCAGSYSWLDLDRGPDDDASSLLRGQTQRRHGWFDRLISASPLLAIGVTAAGILQLATMRTVKRITLLQDGKHFVMDTANLIPPFRKVFPVDEFYKSAAVADNTKYTALTLRRKGKRLHYLLEEGGKFNERDFFNKIF